ncbi:WD40/YVTN/BNR-like repeat-containing protein [Pseudomonas sp. TE3610]
MGVCAVARQWLKVGILALVISGAAQAGPLAPAKAVTGLLTDIASAGARQVAVGERGHVLLSDDQGRSWMQAQVPSQQLLTAVYFADAQHGWAVGHDTQILATVDGGATWRLQFQDPARQAPLLGLHFLDAQHGFAVGAYGALLSTDDGGQHWQDVSERLDNPDQLHLNAIAAVKDAGLVIVGEQGLMFRSADAGQTWQRLQGPYEGSLFGAVGTAQSRTLLVFGLRGHVFRSSDFGDSWQPIAVQGERGPLEAGLANARLLDDGTLMLVGEGGTVLRSVDDGQSFSRVTRPDRQALASAIAVSDGLLLVGENGVHHTDNNGSEGQQP